MKEEKTNLTLKRPPMVIMTMTAAKEANCAALKKMLAVGAEVVVVDDHHIEDVLKLAEKIRYQFKL